MVVSKHPMLLEVVQQRIRLKHYPQTGSRTGFGPSIHAIRVDTEVLQSGRSAEGLSQSAVGREPTLLTTVKLDRNTRLAFT